MIAISTAFKKALIGVNVEGKFGYKELDSNCKHSENILPKLNEILEQLNVELKDNDSYAVVIGPGSFTGLRIGISLIKGFLAGGGNKNIVALTTNELMAYTYLKESVENEEFYTVIDALSGLYFICQFSKDGEKIGKERMVQRDELENLPGKKIGLKEEEIAGVDDYIDIPAEYLLELALLKQKKGEFISPELLAPLYLRKSQAETNLQDAENFKKNKNF